MPTMTKQTLDRRLNRHSLDNQLDNITANSRRQMRYSLTSAENKENFGVHFQHSPFGNTSFIALHDLSNGKSPNRPETPTSLRRRTLGALAVSATRITPLRTSRNATAGLSNNSNERLTNEDTSAKKNCHTCFQLRLPEESLSSTRMGDMTLDLVLDAIIESARKEKKAICKRAKENLSHDFQVPQVPETRSLTTLNTNDDFLEVSIHEMEVCTPPHLKRQRVVRRKNIKTINKTTAQMELETKCTTNISTVQMLESSTPVLLGLTTVNVHCNPSTPLLRATYDECEKSIQHELNRTATPSPEEAQSIKRCLSFSSDDDVDFSEAKRSSVASSNASSMNGEFFHLCSGRWSRSSRNSMRLEPKGCLELSTFYKDKVLNVHVIRCRDLQRSSGSTLINAYVKVAILTKSAKNTNKIIDNNYQRTAVYRQTNRPYFDHWFKFDLKQSTEHCILNNFDAEDRLQLAVWHRDRQLKRSEFLGCLSLPLQTLLQEAVTGAYKLQSQTCLNNPQTAVPITTTSATTILTATTTTITQTTRHPITITTTRTTTAAEIIEFTAPTITPAFNNNCIQINQQLLSDMTTTAIAAQHHKSDEDIVNIDSTAGNLETGSIEQPMVLSKKALHQRDADENLFLRFLELDPAPAEATATNTASSAASAAGSTRRLSNTPQLNKPIGRTPFTMTKRLTRTVECGFGFSIVWTHPPRVEKVEPGLSADRKGILPGDYVIFVDKHNVVTMPEADVLNLIRAQGSSLTLEIFRRQATGTTGSIEPPALSYSTRSNATTLPMNGKSNAAARPNHYASDEVLTITTTVANVPTPAATGKRQQAVNNNITNNNNNNNNNINSNSNIRAAAMGSMATISSMEAAKRRLNLPQVTFSKESIVPITDNRRRLLLQLISREQNFISALHFGMQRFVTPLQERKDLISPNDHRTLFQNIDELLRISEDILEQLSNDGHEPQMNFASRVYLSKTTAICAAYKKYCNGIKRADCVLVNKSRQAGSDFVAFITEPQVPRKRPDLTMFIHRPLQHFREILKLMQLLASNCAVDTEEYKNFASVINELQAAYREITVSSGLMEPLGEGRPLLTLQDLESRMVFTKCKPFTLAVQGRQWIFGGDLSRVEGRSVKPYWTLLFSDIIVFAKVSRDRVLFITEEPVPIANIVDSCFNMRKKTTEFRLTVDPNGRMAESPTGYCAPDLTRTPKKGLRRKNLILRAPSLELKAVWQNLLQRQIFLVNAALGSTPLSSPLDSPDVLNTLVPLSDVGYASASIGSIKISSMDSINLRNQQILQQQQHQHQHHYQQPQQTNRLAHTAQLEMLIDEKCRILNKTGTAKSSALHLANWMKGQLDKQQEEARLATDRSAYDDVQQQQSDSDQEERITYWTRQQLEKRTKELHLEKEMGLHVKQNNAGKRLSGVEELSMSDAYSEGVSQISQSHSTTSGSQITVRSSPIVLDKLAVCRHCHKNCQQAVSGTPKNQLVNSQTATITTTSIHASSVITNSNAKALSCHQTSPNRCCRFNGQLSRSLSGSSLSSSTITVDKPSERSSKIVASSRRETGDTESDFAQLLTDDISQSEATCDNVAAIPSTTGTSSIGKEDTQPNKIADNFNSLRVLSTTNSDKTESSDIDGNLLNGHAATTAKNIEDNFINSQNCLLKSAIENNNITIELDKKEQTPKIVTIQIPSHKEKISTPTKSPKSPRAIYGKSSQFIPCNCDCSPADFENTTLSPDEIEQQTCKILASPKQSPQITLQTKNKNKEEIDLTDLAKSLTIDVTSIRPVPTETKVTTESIVAITEGPFLPTIAVVPATPEAVLTKTSTNIWDNRTTYCNISTTSLQMNNSARRVVVDNLPEDSNDESPLDEELPYRPMSNTLRRYGTLSSLEKLPSDERIGEDDYDDLDDQYDHADDADDDMDDNAQADGVDYVRSTMEQKLEHASHAAIVANSKMTFFEESRAFIDRYLGRWNHDTQLSQITAQTDEQLDECTSGGTSGEEVWGTPTSGGDNDDMNLINSENTYSSPTKSSNSLNDDDDTELMMDELLMAPPMTASAIRGLLPRRRLEPLFEEETESDEEKTQQESEELQKGETTSNGRNSGNSSICTSDAETTNEGVKLLHSNLQTSNLGPRPLRHPATLLPTAVLKASACETLLERHTLPNVVAKCTQLVQREQTTTLSSTTTLTTAATMMKSNNQSNDNLGTLASTSTTISNVNVTTSKDGDVLATAIDLESQTSISVVRQAKFHPPPPPPRRLLLTQNKCEKSGTIMPIAVLEAREKYGDTVDGGSQVDATDQKSDIIGVHLRKTAKANISKEKSNVRSSSTIIETSLLGSDFRTAQICRSSTTASMTSSMNQKKMRPMSSMKIPSPLDKREENSSTVQTVYASNLSPRLEMRLALNHDIMGDEDLMCYNPGPHLTTILGHDLSTFQRRTGRDLLHHTIIPSAPGKEAVILCSQQRNSKMDTPTVNRRPRPSSSNLDQQQQQTTTMAMLGLGGGSARVAGAPQHLQPNRNTWSSSAYAERNDDGSVANVVINKNYKRNANNLSDLEALAKREKIYCMSQSKNGSPPVKKILATMTKSKDSLVNHQLRRTTSAKSMHNGEIETDLEERNMASGMRSQKFERDETALTESGRGNRLINFLKRRNSEISNSSSSALGSQSPARSHNEHSELNQTLSPRKDVDKPSLNRRLWKQITRRRRASSMSEIVAS